MGPQLYRCGNSSDAADPLAGLIASMGPQLYRCGNIGWAILGITAAFASIGPQLYRCGNKNTVKKGGAFHAELQWGRNFIVAEMCVAQNEILWRAFASMGPQLYRCGNQSRRIPMHRRC